MNAQDDFVYTTGYRQAMRVGLPASEWDDCAAGFRLCLLSKYPDHERLAKMCSDSPALIVHCARQYALDYRRRLCRREWLWSQSGQIQDESDSYDIANPDNALDTLLSSIALRQQLTHASVTLSPTTYKYLIRRFYHQESYAEIAGASGKNVNAIEQTVSRALKRLRLHFQNQECFAQNNVDVCGPPPFLSHLLQWTQISNIKNNLGFPC